MNGILRGAPSSSLLKNLHDLPHGKFFFLSLGHYFKPASRTCIKKEKFPDRFAIGVFSSFADCNRAVDTLAGVYNSCRRPEPEPMEITDEHFSA